MNRFVVRAWALRARPRPEKVIAVAAMCVALALGVGSDASDRSAGAPGSLPEVGGSPPTDDHLIGTWREERVSGPAFVRFDRNGTFAMDTVTLDVPYDAAGTYELEGDTVAFVSNGPDCDSSWRWRVGIVEGANGARDELDVVSLDEWCQQLRGDEHTFARVAP